MSPTPSEVPRWFTAGTRLLWPALEAAHERLTKRGGTDVNLDVIPRLAAIHLHHCLDTSIKVNQAGQHAVAISLVRQCFEALTVMDVGLQDPKYGDDEPTTRTADLFLGPLK